MKRCAIILGLLLTATLLGAGAPLDLVRRGNGAFERGQYAVARDCYEQAGQRITDPGLAAFNRAAALSQLAEYREAEGSYRACLEDAVGLRRARALLGLGNSLLRQYRERGNAVVQEAIEVYQTCLREDDLDSDTVASVRHNLELAKLLLAQSISSRPPENEPPQHQQPKKNTPEKSKPENKEGTTRKPSGVERPDPRSPASTEKPANGQQPIPTHEKQPAGGSLPPIPDHAALAKLSAEDAEKHLNQAISRISQERRVYRYRATRLPGGGLMDW